MDCAYYKQYKHYVRYSLFFVRNNSYYRINYAVLRDLSRKPRKCIFEYRELSRDEFIQQSLLEDGKLDPSQIFETFQQLKDELLDVLTPDRYLIHTNQPRADCIRLVQQL